MFTLENNQLTLDADLIASVPLFKQIWDRDELEDKKHAMAFFSFIYHTINPRSPFHGYNANDRGHKFMEQSFPPELKDRWEPYKDKLVLQAGEAYKKFLNLSPERRLLDAAEMVLHETADKLERKGTKNKEALFSDMMRNVENVKKLRVAVAEDEEKKRIETRGEKVSAREHPDYKPLYIPRIKPATL